jgi:hypothetical protein
LLPQAYDFHGFGRPLEPDRLSEVVPEDVTLTRDQRP